MLSSQLTMGVALSPVYRNQDCWTQRTIMPDKDEKYGQPVVQNGLPLSKTHHAAFDAHLIGIDPDYFLHVSETLLELHDGPLLESIKQLKGRKILLPSAARNYPDQNRLAERLKNSEKLRKSSGQKPLPSFP